MKHSFWRGLLLLSVLVVVGCACGSYNYCQINIVQPAQKSLNPATNPLFKDDAPTDDNMVYISNMDLTGHVIVSHPVDSEFRVVLIPVLYQNDVINEKMPIFVDILRQAYVGLPVEFSYVDLSFPVSLTKLGNTFMADNDGEWLAVLQAVRRVRPVDAIVLVCNLRDDLGSTIGYELKAAGIAGENKRSFYTIIHEVGHLLGLEDGYNGFFGEDRMNGSELFLNAGSLAPHVKRAKDRINPEIKLINNRCRDARVYAFFPRESVMSNINPTNSKMLCRLKRQNPHLFTEFQKEVMRQYILERLGQ